MGGAREDGESSLPAHGSHVSRRSVLGAGAAGALGVMVTLAGCGLRLDLPEPAPPPPTRRRVPDEALLIATVRQLRGARLIGDRLGSPDAKQPAVAAALGILREQDRVLTGRLTNDGVPTDVIDAAGPLDPASAGDAGPSTASTGSPTGAPSPRTSRSELATALAAGPGWDTVAAATEPNRLLLLSAASARLAAATQLGRQLSRPGSGTVLVRTELAERTAALVYAYEVVAAHSSGEQREQALHTLGALRSLFDDLGSLGPGFDLPGGWSLPFPVKTSADAARLAQEVLRRAIAGTTTVDGAGSGADLADVAVWSARLQVLGTEHDVELIPFPGTAEGQTR